MRASARDRREGPRYAGDARLLSLAIGSTGLLTAVYLAAASHVLDPVAAKRIDLVWSVLFVVISIVHRPIEQLLSRSIADQRARGGPRTSLRVPLLIQAGFALAFLAVTLALHREVREGVMGGSEGLFVVFVVAVLLYSCSYAARGWLAGHQRFGLYGALAILEATARLAFVLVVAVGLTHGELAVALGIAAGPLVSLAVVPLAVRRRRDRDPGAARAVAMPRARVRESGRFAVAVAAIMLGEQALLNAGVLAVDGSSADAALAGIAFNVLLIARAPLQLFGSVQTSLLPHLATLEVRGDGVGFARAVRLVIRGVLAFTAVVVVGLLLVGPPVMRIVFGQDFDYGRVGLALVGVGMGLHLAASTLSQSALARGRAVHSGALWLACSALYVGWIVLPLVRDVLLRIEVGYAVATGLLALGLLAVHRRGHVAVA